MKNPNRFYRLHWQVRPPAIIVFLSDQLTAYLQDYNWSEQQHYVSELSEFAGKVVSARVNLFGEQSFGFGNYNFFNPKNKQLKFALPRLQTFTENICKYCNGTGKLGWRNDDAACLMCDGTGRALTETDWSKLNDLAASLELFFFLARRYCFLTGIPQQQNWLSIRAYLSHERHSCAISFELGEQAQRFVSRTDYLELAKANRAITLATNFLFSTKNDLRYDTRCCIENGRLFIDCPMRRFSVWSKAKDSKESECHNVDGPYNVVILLVGLCAFCDEAYSFFTKK
jgi:hypothetical protein